MEEPPRIEDVVQVLGHLTLGTRLRRIGERLQADTQALLERSGFDVPAAHFPVLVALDRLGPLSVGELALALGIRQPGVTRTVNRLEARGWVVSGRDERDLRVRRLTLTPEGQQLVARSRRDVWPRIEAAVADACSELSGPLLDQLTALEQALATTPLAERARRLEGSDDRA